MKKLIFLLLCIPVSVYAFGTFQFVKFDMLAQGIAGIPYTSVINFIYSGDWTPRVSILGDTLPAGLSLGKVMIGANGVDYIKLEGTPSTPGVYNLTLLLTDNNGATLTKDVTVTIDSGSTFKITKNNLPVAVVGKPFSGDITISYIGYSPDSDVGWQGEMSGITMTSQTLPEASNYPYTTGIRKGQALLHFSGTPLREGDYPVNVFMNFSNKESKAVTFTLKVVKEGQAVAQEAKTINTLPSAVVKSAVPEQKAKKVTQAPVATQAVEKHTTALEDNTEHIEQVTPQKQSIFTKIKLFVRSLF